MTIPVEIETDIELDFPRAQQEELIRQVVVACLDAEACPYEAEVDVLLTDNASIHDINKAERGIDAPTDVLSFPMVDYKEPGYFDDLEERDDCFHPESGELLLGDMVISLDKVKEQAQEYGHSQRRELAFLVAHSMFHLMGYDHMEDSERLVMEEKQEAVLRQLGITRD